MTNTVDLHIHTKHSDGTDSLKKILEMASDIGLNYISITDHESMEAYKNINALNIYNLNIIPGVELHTFYDNNEVHLLAYGINHENSDIVSYLKRLRKERTEIAYETVKRIQKYGIPLQWEDVLINSGLNVAVTKGHIISSLAKFNIENDEFYYNFFSPFGKYYLPYKNNPISEAIEIVKSNRGQAILAHPGLIMDDRIVEEILRKFDTGLEVYYYYYGSQRDDWIKKYKTMALDYGKVCSGGSDYHGHITRTKLGGVYVPETIIEKILI